MGILYENLAMEPPWAAVQVGLLPCSPRPASPALLSSFSLSLWAYTFYKLLFFFIVSVLFQEEGPLNACVKPATSNQKPVQNSLIGSSLIPDVCPDTLPPFPKKTAALHPRILTWSSPHTGPLPMLLPLPETLFLLHSAC